MDVKRRFFLILRTARRKMRLWIFCGFFLATFWLFSDFSFGSDADGTGERRSKFGGSYFAQLFYSSTADIVISDIYKRIKFHGRSIEPPIRPPTSEKPVQMIVLPHSHCDPGWIYTFEEYFGTYAHSILRNAAHNLQKSEKLRFIYAEISFVDLFMQHSDQQTRDLFIKAVNDGRLELVTAGWVQTDEANSLVYGMLLQLIEGNEYVQNHFGVVPTNHWSIDPFGHSPVMSYVMKEAGFEHAVLNRIHYELLRKFGRDGDLEFKWRPEWTRDEGLLIHVMPYGHYDSARSCGPDFSVCCRLDFLRHSQQCYDEFGGKEIVLLDTPERVKEMATSLADQVKKKRDLFKHDAVFLNIGEDFRFQDPGEFPIVGQNFQKIFDFLDKNASLGVKGRFGTLKDFFDAARSTQRNETINSMSGDFFTYSDRDDHYWSGYFTSRPHHKQLDRTVHGFLRAADLLFTEGALSSGGDEKEWNELFSLLVHARRNLSLYQHHDGLPGTSQPHVMKDYEQRLLNAIRASKEVIANTTAQLLGLSKVETIESSSRLQVIAKKRLEVNDHLLLFNPLLQPTREVVCVRVGGNCPLVLAPTDQPAASLKQQCGSAHDIVGSKVVASASEIEVCFVAEVVGLGFRKFRVETPTAASATSIVEQIDGEKLAAAGDSFVMENALFSAKFSSKTGFLQLITNKFASTETPVSIEFRTFGTRPRKTKKTVGPDSMSGHYLFLPDGPSKAVNASRTTFFLLRGAVRSTVFVQLEAGFSVVQKISLDMEAEGLRVNNVVDLSGCTENIELAMRVSTSPDLREFFTDLNGFALTKRLRYPSLPAHGRFYPMASAAFFQNEKRRLSLLARQPLGVGNEADGQIEVVLDRKLKQTDDRGDLEPLTDNVPVESEFVLLPESFYDSPSEDREQQTAAYHSLNAQSLLLSMHNPPILMKTPPSDNHKDLPFTSLLVAPMPCDVHLLMLRTTAGPTDFDKNQTIRFKKSVAAVFQRLGTEKRLGIPDSCSKAPQKVKVGRLLRSAPKSITNVSLSLLHTYGELGEDFEYAMKPMELKTFRLNY